MVPALEKILLPRSLEPLFDLRLKFRWVALIIGGLLIVWLPVEDVNLNNVIRISVLVLVWGAGYYLLGRMELSRKVFAKMGLTAGLLVGPLAVVLILLKGGLHGHGFLDFSTEQIFSLLYFSPVWGLSGWFLGGIAGWIYERIYNEE